MTDEHNLVWYEADGTRHEFDETAAAPSAVTPPAFSPEPEPAAPSPLRPETPDDARPDGEGDQPAESTDRATKLYEAVAAAAAASKSSAQPGPGQSTRDEPGSVDEEVDEEVDEDSGSSPMRGMLRSLALGAAAAAATGIIVGAISLSATGSRPDTFESTSTTVIGGPDGTEGAEGMGTASTTDMGRVDLIPATNAPEDQPE